jgi:hypothetical protein
MRKHMLKFRFLRETPHWDPNDDQGYQQFELYQGALVGGMKEGPEC